MEVGKKFVRVSDFDSPSDPFRELGQFSRVMVECRVVNHLYHLLVTSTRKWFKLFYLTSKS